MAIGAGYSQSPETSAQFNVTLPVPMPAISPNGGTFASSQLVSIADSLGGTAIYYTIDGSTPTTGSKQYTGAFTVSTSETISAIAISPGGTSSAVNTVTVMVPHVFPAGLAMISVPEDYTGQSLDAILGYSSPKLAIWDAVSNTYSFTPAQPANSLAVGLGYWVRFPASETSAAVGVPTPTDSQFTIVLHKGWNMVGDPFPADVQLSDLSIVSSAGIAVPFDDALSSGVIGGPVYGFNGTSYIVSTTLSPYQGYWVLATSDCTLSVPPPQ